MRVDSACGTSLSAGKRDARAYALEYYNMRGGGGARYPPGAISEIATHGRPAPYIMLLYNIRAHINIIRVYARVGRRPADKRKEGVGGEDAINGKFHLRSGRGGGGG